MSSFRMWGFCLNEIWFSFVFVIREKCNQMLLVSVSLFDLVVFALG
jgi:hypothetical protein